MKIRLNSLEEVEVLANSFIETIFKKKKDTRALVVGLRGDLGAGKTTFTKSIAKAFGVEGAVTSPTFVIEKIYKLPEDKTFSRLIHIDAYRLESGSELLQLGWEDIISDPENIILIEWPEKVSDILPEDIHIMHFKFIDENTREVEY
jgi:tRNA threonylcarbamoyladenosine biosynthesis protein TsaE